MRLFIWEANDFLFYCWAIARTLAFPFISLKNWQLIPVLFNYWVCIGVCFCHMAFNCLMFGSETTELVYERKRLNRIIWPMPWEPWIVYTRFSEARWCASSCSSHRKVQPLKSVSQPYRRRFNFFAVPHMSPSWITLPSDVNHSSKKSSRRHNKIFCFYCPIICWFDGFDGFWLFINLKIFHTGLCNIYPMLWIVKFSVFSSYFRISFL